MQDLLHNMNVSDILKNLCMYDYLVLHMLHVTKFVSDALGPELKQMQVLMYSPIKSFVAEFH